jgi:hypothetical protein
MLVSMVLGLCEQARSSKEVMTCKEMISGSRRAHLCRTRAPWLRLGGGAWDDCLVVEDVYGAGSGRFRLQRYCPRSESVHPKDGAVLQYGDMGL